MTQDIQGTDAPATRSSRVDWRGPVLRRLRLEEALFLCLFIPSMIVTAWANIDLYTEGIRSRRIRGGILRLVIVVAIAAMLPVLDRWRHRLPYGVGRGAVEFFRTFLPFALCTAVYTNLHDTIRWINPNDIHDTLMVIEEWMFGGQPVVWAEQFITPARTEFFSLIYTNFFLLTIVVSCVLWAGGRRQEARETMLGIIVCFYSGYVLYVLFPAAPPRLYFESLGMFSVDLRGGSITDFQNALINMMPNQASRARFPESPCRSQPGRPLLCLEILPVAVSDSRRFRVPPAGVDGLSPPSLRHRLDRGGSTGAVGTLADPSARPLVEGLR